ncbi:nucleotidyltransferase domain-containing protein [Aquabacterium sp. A08]|uniref:GSU2403 family nucleotidyltransferase fold protein n=1 Tax=Aquabacterium sp. A08 TaxID=2718532 RepID=UPI0014249F82|nr:nucleotidyltransferase domain-containing protein [Aquabacterium sp. A08]NIC41495.1 hypothetical protein [Aquabacterium sp. A08]
MPASYQEQPVATSTAYAQLHTATLGLDFARDASHLSGSFGTKTIKGKVQWYFSFRDVDQTVRQLYVGADSPALRQLVQNTQAHTPRKHLQGLAKSAVVLGCVPVARKHLTVILRLSEYGFFRAGGVLVGTHAFLAFANQLGVRWLHSEQTTDIDFAHAGRNISIALPASIKAQPHSALNSLQQGFLPMVAYRGGAGASYRHGQEPEFQIDFLTTQTSAQTAPITIDHLDVALQPLRFMEFSLEHVQQATLFDGTGRAVVVNLPAPERYAVHKLLIVGERTGAFRAKVAKDLAQAHALIEYFHNHDPDALLDTWQDALQRGPGWRKRALEGQQALAQRAPALAAWLVGGS